MVSSRNKNKIRWACRNRKSLTFTSYKLSNEEVLAMEDILAAFLEEMNLSQIRDQLSYCLRELAVNAKKANTKRIYFTEKGLNIDYVDDYEIGMKSFKDETLSDIDSFLDLQENAGLHVKVGFHISRDQFMIRIQNNSELVIQEKERIQEKLKKARQYTNLQEAFSSVFDESEGAGLGIVIMVLMLRNLGMDQSAFSFISENGHTTVQIGLPLDNQAYDYYSLISGELLNQIDNLPSFPNHLQEILSFLENGSGIDEIALKILIDPALTANILRIVNDPNFGLETPIANLRDALDYIGLKGLKDIISTLGSTYVLEQYPQQGDVWMHSRRTAFYALELQKYSECKADKFEIYTAALLHDIGKVLFNYAYPQASDKIEEFCTAKGIPVSVLEELGEGTSHGVIGAMMARKWNFPKPLITAVEYHHHPEAAPKKYYDLCSIVYLADVFANYEENKLDFSIIEPAVLYKYSVSSKSSFIKLHEEIENNFIAQEIIPIYQ